MPVLYDRQGQAYQVTSEEAAAMLATGAYFSHPDVQETSGVAVEGRRVLIHEVASGVELSRRPVDAAELVGTGRYKYGRAVTAIRTAPAPIEPKSGLYKQPASSLPALSMENTKDEICQVLSQYRIRHRSGMGKADLLRLWAEFVGLV